MRGTMIQNKSEMETKARQVLRLSPLILVVCGTLALVTLFFIPFDVNFILTALAFGLFTFYLQWKMWVTMERVWLWLYMLVSVIPGMLLCIVTRRDYTLLAPLQYYSFLGISQFSLMICFRRRLLERLDGSLGTKNRDRP